MAAFNLVSADDPGKGRRALNAPSIPTEWDDSGDGDYMVGDLVTRHGSLYRVTVDHTSGDPESFVGTRYERVVDARAQGISDSGAAGRAVVQAATGATARAVIDAQGVKPAVHYTPVGKPDGAIGYMDSGQAVTSFGNSPGGVDGGLIKHAPTAGSQTAAYKQVDAGGTVTRIGCEVQWPSGSVAAVALVLPISAWGPAGGWDSSNAARVVAGLHFVIYGNGIWHCSRWNAPGETTYADESTYGRFSSVVGDGKFHKIEAWVDHATSTATVFFPDGTSATFSNAAIGSDTSSWAIWEQYEFTGTAETPVILRNLWADTQERRIDGFAATPADLVALLTKANQWGFTNIATAAGTTTLTATSSPFQQFYGSTTQTVKLPSTGVPAGAHYLINNSSTGAVTVQAADGSSLGALATGNSMLVSSISANPASSGNWSPMILATVNTTQTFTGKRIDPRVTSAASASTLSPNISTADLYAYTALATNLSINSPTGTVDGARIRYRFKDNGTSRTLTWNAIFRAIGVTIPTATTVGKTLYVDTFYNAADTKWDVIGVVLET